MAFAVVVGVGLWAVSRLAQTPQRWRRCQLAAAYGLGIVATFWVFERVAGF